MPIDFQSLDQQIRSIQDPEPFSGSVYLTQADRVLFAHSYGYALRSERIPNRLDTRFQTASGSKIFTAVAICQLIETGRLTLDTRLQDCLPVVFPLFDEEITVRQLLTHTSGITSYFEEDVNPDYEALWQQVPVYRMRTPFDFLPLLEHKPMKFRPGERFEYNDGGFVLLGAIVEQVSGLPFRDYIQKHIFRKAHMVDSGYFAADRLPPRTALAYIQDPDGFWRSNIFAVPVMGGGDGGAYVTALDWYQFWVALRTHKLLGEQMTRELLHPHVQTSDSPPNTHYGYGVWIHKQDQQPTAYFVEGFDPGVAMFSSVYPDQETILTVLGNATGAVWPVIKLFQSTFDLV